MDTFFIISLFLIAVFTEYIDGSVGMGYGTTLAPILIVLGFEPIHVILSVIVSQLIADLVMSIMNHLFGNANFSPKSTDTKVSIILGSTGLIGCVIGASVALNLPRVILTAYIGILVFSMGLLTVINVKRKALTMRKTILLGIFASFNKSVTGGGYGPILAGVQIMLGENSKQVVARTSLAEAIVCTMSIVAYILAGVSVNYLLIIIITTGAVTATPFSAYTISKIKEKNLRKLMATVMMILGIITIFKAFLL